MAQKETYKRIFEIMDCESDDSNFTIPFGQICKKYGKEYREFCIAAWQANGDCQTEEEFMRINGNMPRGYFDKVVKNGK
jgi:hypothetical protein